MLTHNTHYATFQDQKNFRSLDLTFQKHDGTPVIFCIRLDHITWSFSGKCFYTYTVKYCGKLFKLPHPVEAKDIFDNVFLMVAVWGLWYVDGKHKKDYRAVCSQLQSEVAA